MYDHSKFSEKTRTSNYIHQKIKVGRLPYLALLGAPPLFEVMDEGDDAMVWVGGEGVGECISNFDGHEE
jgi:hypothetical protein